MFDNTSLFNFTIVLIGISSTMACFFRQTLRSEGNEIENIIDDHLLEFLNRHKKYVYSDLKSFKKGLLQGQFRITLDPDEQADLYKALNSLFWSIITSVLFIGSVLLIPFFGLAKGQTDAISNIISSYSCLINIVVIIRFLFFLSRIDWKTSVKNITMFDRIKLIKSKI
jgi:hypothetical protein